MKFQCHKQGLEQRMEMMEKFRQTFNKKGLRKSKGRRL